MKRSLLVRVICIAIFSLCGSSTLAQDTQGPKMVLKERVFDFKEVKEGEVIEHTFIAFNQGEETLEIEKVKPG